MMRNSQVLHQETNVVGLAIPFGTLALVIERPRMPARVKRWHRAEQRHHVKGERGKFLLSDKGRPHLHRQEAHGEPYAGEPRHYHRRQSD